MFKYCLCLNTRPNSIKPFSSQAPLASPTGQTIRKGS